jgi:hypothetical protein
MRARSSLRAIFAGVATGDEHGVEARASLVKIFVIPERLCAFDGVS